MVPPVRMARTGSVKQELAINLAFVLSACKEDPLLRSKLPQGSRTNCICGFLKSAKLCLSDMNVTYFSLVT